MIVGYNGIMHKLVESLRRIHWKLFLALLLMGFCPAIYTTVRTYILGTLPGEWSYSIAGQLSWVNLIYEILNEALILPLFFFVGSVVNDRKEFTNRIRSGLLITLILYSILSAVVSIFAEPLLNAMATSKEIIRESVTYIRIESVANVFSILFSFACVAIITLGKDSNVYVLTGAKLILCLVSDVFFVRRLGVNGIGLSNIAVNLVLVFISLILLSKHGCNIFSEEKLSFRWVSGLAMKGGISGLESFVRNVAYMLMVSRMVNMVGEQGTYWVANNFIWGWLLLPINQLAELIKQETSTNENDVRNNSLAYFFITGCICLIWIVLIPTYKPFMRHALNYSDVDKLYGLVMLLLGFYVLYAIQNVFDSTFYGCGRTDYMLLESVVTNSVYYGTFFILYLTGRWVPTLTGIALMFGFGNMFDTFVSGVIYIHFLRRRQIITQSIK